MSGRRAAFKLATKNARRNRKRTIFLILLVAVPVAFGVVMAGVVRASFLAPEERVQAEFGVADVRVDLFAPKPGVAEWVYATVGEISPDTVITLFNQTWFRVPGAGHTRVSDLDLTDPTTEGLLVLVDGRAPTSDGEVAVSPALAKELDVAVGDSAEFERLPFGGLEIVGLVGQPFNNESLELLLSPGRLESLVEDPEVGVASVIFLTGAEAESAAFRMNDLWYSEGQPLFWPAPAVDPKPQELEFLEDQIYVLLTESGINELVGIVRDANEAGEDFFSAVYDRANQLVFGSGAYQQLPDVYVETRTQALNQGGFEDKPGLVSTGAAALLLVEVAFITGAAFAAGTRRRLREIGLMGANGASEKHVRVTVISEGLTIGLIGALVGVVSGIGVLLLARPILHRFVSRLIMGTGVTFSDVIGPVAVALVSVLLAVLIPARTASKVPTTTALQGRMPALSPRRWVVPIGIASSAVGLLVISVALVSDSNYAAVMVGVGAVLLVGGVAMMSSPILAAVSKLADHVPATSRLVLRDSGRNRTRSAVAVAAIMVILLAPITAMTTAATTTQKDLVFGLPSPSNHLLVSGSFASSSRFAGLDPVTEADVDAVASVVPSTKTAMFDTLDLRLATDEQLTLTESGDQEIIIRNFTDGYQAAVGSTELLLALGHPDVTHSIEEGELVVLGLEDKKTRVSLNGVEYPASEYAVPVLKWSMPRVLIPESMASSFPEVESRPMALLVLESPLTNDDWIRLGDLSLQVDGGHGGLSAGQIYLVMGGVTLLVVLIVIALVTAVSAAEVDEEIRTIVAVGAPGAIRRRFLGLLTGYQTLIAMMLAVPLSLGLVWVFSSTQNSISPGPFGVVNGSDVTIPWVQLVAFAIALPLIIGLLTLITVRSAPVTPPRRAT